MIKVPATAAGHPRHPAADRRRHQRQRDAAVRAGRLRAGGRRRTSRGSSSLRRARRRPVACRQRGQLLRQPDRYRRSTRSSTERLQANAERARAGVAALAHRQRRDRQREAAYQRYQEIFAGPRWQALGGRGAQTQRLLWASTGTKNPALPRRRLCRRADRPRHGQHDAAGDARRVPRPRPAARSLAEDVDAARDTMAALAEVGISMKEVTDALLADGRAAVRRARSTSCSRRSSGRAARRRRRHDQPP